MQVRLRCSELPIFMACPSSAEDSSAPVKDTSEASELGQAVHEALAQMLEHQEIEFAQIASKYGCDEQELTRLYSAGTYAWDYISEHFEGPNVEGYAEREIAPGIVITGHPDLNTTEAVLDWKSGWRLYNPRWQLNGYGILTGATLGVIVWLRYRKFQVIMLMTEDEFRDRLLEQIRLIGKQYSPGEHCAWCGRRDTCPAHAKHLSRCAELVQQDQAGALSREDLGRLYPALKEMEAKIKAAKDFIRNDVQENGPLPLENGHELALHSTKKRVIDPLLAWPSLSQRLGPKTLSGCVSISLTKVEKAIKDGVPKGAPRGSKKKVIAATMSELHEAGAIGYAESSSLRERSRSDGK